MRWSYMNSQCTLEGSLAGKKYVNAPNKTSSLFILFSYSVVVVRRLGGCRGMFLTLKRTAAADCSSTTYWAPWWINLGALPFGALCFYCSPNFAVFVSDGLPVIRSERSDTIMDWEMFSGVIASSCRDTNNFQLHSVQFWALSFASIENAFP